VRGEPRPAILGWALRRGVTPATGLVPGRRGLSQHTGRSPAIICGIRPWFSRRAVARPARPSALSLVVRPGDGRGWWVEGFLFETSIQRVVRVRSWSFESCWPLAVPLVYRVGGDGRQTRLSRMAFAMRSASAPSSGRCSRDAAGALLSVAIGELLGMALRRSGSRWRPGRVHRLWYLDAARRYDWTRRIRSADPLRTVMTIAITFFLAELGDKTCWRQ